MDSYLSQDWVRQNLPKRALESHKGTYGTLLLLVGSSAYRGAAVLAASGALRAGAGLVCVASIEKVCAAVAAQLPCCTFLPLLETPQGGIISSQNLPIILAQNPTTILTGCGLSATEDTAHLMEGLLTSATCPLVFDADALNLLAGHLNTGFSKELRLRHFAALDAAKIPVILTPHIGEMARLTGLSTAQVTKTQVDIAREFAKAHHCTVVLKSYTTVVTTPEGDAYINESAGNPGLAKGGSGDVLAGIIASLLAQGRPPPIAAAAGVFLHAAAADKAVQTLGEAGLSPADIPHFLALFQKELGR